MLSFAVKIPMRKRVHPAGNALARALGWYEPSKSKGRFNPAVRQLRTEGRPPPLERPEQRFELRRRSTEYTAQDHEHGSHGPHQAK